MSRVLVATIAAVVLLVAVGAVAYAQFHTQPAVQPSNSVGAPENHQAAKNVSLRQTWTQSIQPNADSAPAYAAHPRGHRTPLVYVLAGNNTSDCTTGDPVHTFTLYAFEAASGHQGWARSTTGPSICTTAGPVVDGAGKWVYAAGADGKLHRYNAWTGAEYRKQGWPQWVTVMPWQEKMSAQPAIGKGYIYATTSGYNGDWGHYEGHLVTVNLATGTRHVFNTLCSNIHHLLDDKNGSPYYCPAVMSGLFGRGEGVIDPISRDVYIVTGNGPWNGKTYWGDSILKLSPDGVHLLDSYTPTDQAYLDANDLDLGSTGPALLPTVKHGGKTYHLLVQGGKGAACSGCNGAVLRLLNRDNLSGKHALAQLGGDLSDVSAPGGCEVLTAPAVWTHSGQAWAVYANSCGLAAYRVTFSRGPKLQRVWSSSQGGTTSVIANGVLYVAHDGALNAIDPATGRVLASAAIGSLHWEYPLVAGGGLFMTDQGGHLYAFKIGR